MLQQLNGRSRSTYLIILIRVMIIVGVSMRPERVWDVSLGVSRDNNSSCVGNGDLNKPGGP